ncbi:MAG: alpha/beta hydrolase [Thiolinea sp.]
MLIDKTSPVSSHGLSFRQFGAENRRLIIYFHGAPGSPQECEVFDLYGKQQGLTLLCFDRFTLDPALDEQAYYQALAAAILQKSDSKPVDVIGFSIGAFVALQVCRYLPQEAVRKLHLVSAAAPLEAGHFIETMVGKPVFQLAKNFPTLFIGLSYWQKLLAKFSPPTLYRLLFASAAGQDKVLAANPEFQALMTQVLRECFGGNVKGYTRDIRAYVQAWATMLGEITCDTYIWHGAEDNWSPKEMADYLAKTIPGCVRCEIMENTLHYSTLYAVFSRLEV